jgi:Domain of unknown function (DUF4326)
LVKSVSQLCKRAVARFEQALLACELAISVEDVKRELRGCNVADWCALSQPCHGDVLLRIANE